MRRPEPCRAHALRRTARVITKVLTETRFYRDMERTAIQPARYVWRGPVDAPVFCFENCRDFRIENIDVVCEAPTEAVFVSERTKTGPGTIPPTLNQFRNVRIFGNGLANVGIDYRATIDENNEHGRFDCVSVYGCKLDGFAFSGQQSKEHLLTLCRIEGSLTGISSESGFTMIGGTIAACGEAVELTNTGDPATLIGVGVETCGRLLVTYGPTTAAQPVVLNNVRYEADQLDESDQAIVMRHAGPLVIVGGRYGGGKQRIPRIALRGTGTQTVELRGVQFGSYGAATVAPILAYPGVDARPSASGCVYQSAEGDAQNTVSIPGAFVERVAA